MSEGIGTFLLVFCGTGAVVVDAYTGGTVTHVGISVTFGLIVTAVVYALGDISGAHINPAVTVAFWAAGRIPLREVLPYAISQLAGAALASLVLRLLFPEVTTLGETLPNAGLLRCFILEVILTFILMFVILHVAIGSKEQGIMAGLAIGMTVLLEALFAGPISGASMNPARSFGPALVNWNLDGLWLYFVAPVGGALLSVFAWRATANPH